MYIKVGKGFSFVFAISKVLFPAVWSPDTCPAHLHMTEGLEFSSFPRKTIIQPKKTLSIRNTKKASISWRKKM